MKNQSFPANRNRISRVNVSLTDEDQAQCAAFMEESGSSRADVLRAGLEALKRLSPQDRLALQIEVRQRRPKTGRPPLSTTDN